MTKLMMPAAWSTEPKVSQSTAPVKAATQVSARINMSTDVAGKGLCPDCQQPMISAIANNHEVVTCMPCRIALPKPDSV